MIYTEAEHFIKESHNEVIRLGLGRIEELLERLGCPQNPCCRNQWKRFCVRHDSRNP